MDSGDRSLLEANYAQLCRTFPSLEDTCQVGHFLQVICDIGTTWNRRISEVAGHHEDHPTVFDQLQLCLGNKNEGCPRSDTTCSDKRSQRESSTESSGSAAKIPPASSPCNQQPWQLHCLQADGSTLSSPSLPGHVGPNSHGHDTRLRQIGYSSTSTVAGDLIYQGPAARSRPHSTLRTITTEWHLDDPVVAGNAGELVDKLLQHLSEASMHCRGQDKQTEMGFGEEESHQDVKISNQPHHKPSAAYSQEPL